MSNDEMQVEKNLTPELVRDMMVDCFYEAHGKDAGYQREEAEKLVKMAFTQAGFDYDNPTKESLMGSFPLLKEYSKEFPNQEVIDHHAAEMMDMIQKI